MLRKYSRTTVGRDFGCCFCLPMSLTLASFLAVLHVTLGCTIVPTPEDSLWRSRGVDQGRMWRKLHTHMPLDGHRGETASGGDTGSCPRGRGDWKQKWLKITHLGLWLSVSKLPGRVSLDEEGSRWVGNKCFIIYLPEPIFWYRHRVQTFFLIEKKN